MRIAVTGASGQFGRLVVQQLGRHVRASDIVALARTPGKAADLGVQVREADYSRTATLTPALAGVETLLLVSGSEIGQRVQQQHHVIEAARQASVRRVVYTSLLRADTSPLSLATEHNATETELKASGLAFTILRNGWYTENYAQSIPAALAAGAVIGSAGQGRIASAARADYAAAAAAVLTSSGHEGKTYELAGDEAYTLAEFAAELARQSGTDIVYRDLPPADYATALRAAGLPPALAKAVASWDACAARGALFDDGRQLSTLIGRPTTPLAEVIAAQWRGVR